MTVNERLFHKNLLDTFDKLLTLKDFEGLKIILKKVDLNDSSIEAIIKDLKKKTT